MRVKGEQGIKILVQNKHEAAGAEEDEENTVTVKGFGADTGYASSSTSSPECPGGTGGHFAGVVLIHYSIDSPGYTFPYVAGWACDRSTGRQFKERPTGSLATLPEKAGGSALYRLKERKYLLLGVRE